MTARRRTTQVGTAEARRRLNALLARRAAAALEAANGRVTVYLEDGNPVA